MKTYEIHMISMNPYENLFCLGHRQLPSKMTTYHNQNARNPKKNEVNPRTE